MLIKLKLYKNLYRITRNRKWVVRFIDEYERLTKKDIKEYRNESN